MTNLWPNVLVHIGASAPKDSFYAFANKQVVGPPEKRLRVGIWDLGAWLGNLPVLLDKLNSVQSAYNFFTVEATVPAGMIRQGEGVVQWLRQAGKKVTKKEALEVGKSMVAADFYAIAAPVRTDLGLDYLVGVTPSRIADATEDAEEPEWDYFSTSQERLVLASTADLRRFSKEANIPFDRFLGALIVGQLLVAQFSGSGLGFHTPNTSCLFDYNDNRETVKDSMRKLRLEPACMAKIPPKFRKPAAALTTALAEIK